jgi:nucleoside-diphosphate-sugar epimerase
VYACIADHLGFVAKPAYGQSRAGDIKHSLADITRATKELGYQPKVHFHDGLRKTVDWYLAEKEKAAVAEVHA